jgi:hypothetical protein
MFNSAPSLESGVGCDRSRRRLSTYSTLLHLKTACISLSVRQVGVFWAICPVLLLFFKHDVSETGSVSAFKYKALLSQLVPLEIDGLNPLIDIAFSKGTT